MKPPGLFTCLLTESGINNKPAVCCICQNVQLDNLLDKICFESVSPLRIDNDQLKIFQAPDTFTGDSDSIFLLWVAKTGDVDL